MSDEELEGHGEASSDRGEDNGERSEETDRSPKQAAFSSNGFKTSGFARRSRSFGNSKERPFSSPRNGLRDRSFSGGRDRKFSRDRSFGRERSFGGERKFGGDRKFGDRSFSRDRKFGGDRSFGRDGKFGDRKFSRDGGFRKEKEITTDDFNSMFFSKGSKSSKGARPRSFDKGGSKFHGSKRPFNSSSNGRPDFKRKRFASQD